MSDWEWRRTGRGVRKQINVASVMPAGEGEYGGSFSSDLTTPILWRTYVAKLAPESVADAVEDAALEMLGTYSITDSVGRTFSGYVVECELDDIEGTDRVNVTCRLEKPSLDLSA